MEKYFIKKSTRKNKKYDLFDKDVKYMLSFGAEGYSDFTIHKDDKRKERYILRHSKEDHTENNILSPAFMSRWVLWNKPSLQASINDVNKRFKIHLKLTE